MRFVADVMLGKLAKWLRLLGYDVLYNPKGDDEELAELAKRERRILLTKDTHLVQRYKVKNYLLLESNDWQEQLVQTAAHFKLDLESHRLTRCPECNEVLKGVAKEQVRYQVPSFVFRTQERFAKCPGCGKIYWAGTHYQNANRTLEKLAQRIREVTNDQR